MQLRLSCLARRLAPPVLAAAALAAAPPPAAHAELKVCNQTLSLYNIAVGYFSGERFYTEGWWTLPANACVRPIKGDLDNQFYYFFAMDLYGNDATKGDKPFCANVNKSFRVPTPIADLDRPACWVRGYQQVNFQEIDTGGNATSWTVFVTQGGGGE
jgi:uncharacterized membrane protein